MKVKSYKELYVWQNGIKIVDFIYETTDTFPQEQKSILISQMQRAAISIPSNIAEGFARQHTKEYKQFLYYSLGSCSELETQLIIAQSRKYLPGDKYSELAKLLDYESRMLMNLIKSLG